MNDTTNAPAVRKNSPIAVFQHDLDKMEGEFHLALPKHIPAERFKRVIQTAVANSRDLLEADRRSLWNACMRCAQDGLLPDGREAALVVRKSRDGKQVVYVPMVAGIKKKVRNSGEISAWDINIIYENDEYDIELGDTPRIYHKPCVTDEPGIPIIVYSVATLTGGEKSREVMRVAEINAIRDRSDAWKAFEKGFIKSTPWSTDWGEMAKKTVAKRHAKSLPMSTDLDDLMRRDDDLYAFEKETDAERKALAPPKRQGLAGRMDALVNGGQPQVEEGFDPETGEEIEGTVADESGNRQAPASEAAGKGGKGAGQPATTKPAAADKIAPAKKKAAPTKAKDPEPPPPEDVEGEEESTLAADEEEGATEAVGDEIDDAEIVDDEQAEPLNEENKNLLEQYHATLMKAASPAKLDIFSGDMFPNGPPKAIASAVDRLYRAHYDRITEDHPAADSDNILRQILRGS